MIRNTRKKHRITIGIREFVYCSPNADDPINLSDIPDWNIALHIVNEVTSKRRQTKGSTRIPNKYERTGILRSSRNGTILKCPPKSSYSSNARGDVLLMINWSKLWQEPRELKKMHIRSQESVQDGAWNSTKRFNTAALTWITPAIEECPYTQSTLHPPQMFGYAGRQKLSSI